MSDKYTSADYQHAVGRFVDREVIYCVSNLICELCESSQYSDQLLPVCTADDWETPAYDDGWRVQQDTSGEWFASGSPGNPKETVELDANDEADAWRELCAGESIEPYQLEALEHWIVTDRLADKLEARGEMILRNFLGLTIWGRCCSGQSILLDGVICDIYDKTQSKAA